MPRIPTYQTGTIQDTPMPGVRQQVSGAEGAFGSIVTQAAEQSKTWGKVGDAAFTLAVQERDKIDTARVQETYTTLSKAANGSLYGDQGVLRLQGAAAVGAADKWSADFDKTSQEVMKDLTPRQQALFQKYGQSLKRGFYDNVLRHESQQAVAYQDESYKNLVTTAVDTAALNYTDGNLVGMQIGIATEALRKRPEYVGASAEVRGTLEKNLEAGFHAQVVQAALDGNNTGYANEYFNQVKDRLPFAVQTKIEKHLRPATDFAEGKQLAMEVQGKIATGEMTITQGEAYLTEKAKTPGALSAGQSIMREMQDAQVREANRASGALIEKFEMAPTRATMNSILGSKEFRAMEPEARARLVKYYRGELEQADDRARARRNDQYRSPEAYGKFLETMEDPKFATMSRAEIYNLRDKIGPDLTTKLLAEHKGANSATQAFKIDKDLLNEAIPEELRKPKTRKDEDRLQHFRGIVESELAQWKINNPGKVPTLEEQKAIARSANAEFNVVNRFWPDSTVRAYELKPMPTDFREQAITALRSKGKPVTESALMELWSKQKGSR